MRRLGELGEMHTHKRFVRVLVVVLALVAGSTADVQASPLDGDELTGQVLVDRITSLAGEARGNGVVSVVGEPWAVPLASLGRAQLLWNLRDSGGDFIGLMVSDDIRTAVGVVSFRGDDMLIEGWLLDGDGDVLTSTSSTRAVADAGPVEEHIAEVQRNCELAVDIGITILWDLFCRKLIICTLIGGISTGTTTNKTCKNGSRAHWYVEETTTYPTTTVGVILREWNNGTYVFDNYIEPLECLPPGSGPNYFDCYSVDFTGRVVPNRPTLGYYYKWADGQEDRSGGTGDLLRVYPEILQRTHDYTPGSDDFIRLDVMEDVRGISASIGQAVALHKG